MMALGAGVREGVVYDRPMEPTDLVPTIGSLLDLQRRCHKEADTGTLVN